MSESTCRVLHRCVSSDVCRCSLPRLESHRPAPNDPNVGKNRFSEVTVPALRAEIAAPGTSGASNAGEAPKFARCARGRPPRWLAFSLRSKDTERPRSMPSRRTIRKPTVWAPEEWRHIEQAARARGVPPLRYVREAALAAKLPPATQRRGAHALLHELKRVLNNLHQLLRLAEADGAPSITAALESTIRITHEAAEAAAARRGSAEPLIVAVREAGRVLNELTHLAHVAEELPEDEELGAALASIQFAAMAVPR